jgi:hypothetical protein
MTTEYVSTRKVDVNSSAFKLAFSVLIGRKPVGAGDGNTYIVSPPTETTFRDAILTYLETLDVQNWKLWEGNHMPPIFGVVVKVKFRNGGELVGMSHHFRWDHRIPQSLLHPHDIVAYQTIQDTEK